MAHTLTRANSKQPSHQPRTSDLRRQSNDVDDQHGRGRPSHSPGRGARKLLPLGFYTYPLDPATDGFIEHAALLFAVAMAFMRRPEYVRRTARSRRCRNTKKRMP